MNNKFDELTKDLAQSVTRRGALKRFGVGLGGMVLACFGLADKAGAAQPQRIQGYCQVRRPVTFDQPGHWFYTGICVDNHGCVSAASTDCPANGTLEGDTSANQLGCGGLYVAYDKSKRCSFAT